MKTFGKLSCALCMKERIEILKKRNNKKLINSNDEIYGGCRHRTHFHEFHRQDQMETNMHTDEASESLAERLSNVSDFESVVSIDGDSQRELAITSLPVRNRRGEPLMCEFV